MRLSSAASTKSRPSAARCSSSTDQTRWGGTVGAGLEYGFAPNWSVGVEYNHIFLQDKNVTFALAARAPDRIRQDVDMGLVRLNYKFGGPSLGRY